MARREQRLNDPDGPLGELATAYGACATRLAGVTRRHAAAQVRGSRQSSSWAAALPVASSSSYSSVCFCVCVCVGVCVCKRRQKKIDHRVEIPSAFLCRKKGGGRTSAKWALSVYVCGCGYARVRCAWRTHNPPHRRDALLRERDSPALHFMLQPALQLRGSIVIIINRHQCVCVGLTRTVSTFTPLRFRRRRWTRRRRRRRRRRRWRRRRRRWRRWRHTTTTADRYWRVPDVAWRR